MCTDEIVKFGLRPCLKHSIPLPLALSVTQHLWTFWVQVSRKWVPWWSQLYPDHLWYFPGRQAFLLLERCWCTSWGTGKTQIPTCAWFVSCWRQIAFPSSSLGKLWGLTSATKQKWEFLWGKGQKTLCWSYSLVQLERKLMSHRTRIQTPDLPLWPQLSV